jgi:hypothetical protein
MTEIHEVYGPAATHSEHKKGDSIAYQLQRDWDTEPKTYTGVILWVAAATDDRGICYIVAPDIDTGWIDHVYPGEVVITRQNEAQEPTLVKCPYCPGNTYHYEGQLEQCPNNPNRKNK